MMRITLKPDAKLVKQISYCLNPKYKEKVCLELDNMLEAGIIDLVEESDWVSPMVVQEKKWKDEIRICVDLRKLNDACVHDPFLTSFIDEVLDNVGGQEAYSFTNGFSRYQQIKIALEDRSKMTFATDWGCFQYIVMSFGLKNAPAIFSHVVVAAFKEFIHKFLEAYFDDWTMFGLVKCNVESLHLMLDTCRRYQITLNLKKCLFCVPFGTLLGHVVCRQGLMVDLAKIAVILNLEAPRSVKQLCATLGHRGYYRKFIKGYAQITMPMEKLLKKDVTFCWNEECKKSLDVQRKYGHRGDYSLPGLEERVSCTCRRIMYSTGRSTDTGRRRRIGPSYCVRTALEGYIVQQKKELVVCATDFSAIAGHLYKMGTDEILRWYVLKFDRSSILAYARGGATGGNYAGRETVQKILCTGLWWPTLHQDLKSYCKACDVHQRTSRPLQRDEMPLNPQMMLQPFEKWAIDFMGPIQPQGKTGARYIITTMEYLTRWAEAQPVKDCTGATAANFLFEHVLTRFGCPKILMSDRVLWAYRTTCKKLTGQTPFRLVYVVEAVMPMEYIMPSLRIEALTGMMGCEALEERLADLDELEEEIFLAGFHQQVQKQREKAWHD
eukprot:PITA_04566